MGRRLPARTYRSVRAGDEGGQVHQTELDELVKIVGER